jgi:hypothetical protein
METSIGLRAFPKRFGAADGGGWRGVFGAVEGVSRTPGADRMVAWLRNAGDWPTPGLALARSVFLGPSMAALLVC